MGSSQNEEQRRLFRGLQQMASMIGLDSGKIRMDIHSDRIASIKVSARTTIPIDVRQAEDAVPTTMRCDRHFVINQLQPAITQDVRPFGRINVTVRNGIVTAAYLTRKLRDE